MYQLAVIGNPVAHSLSPHIHGQFAQQCKVALRYQKLWCEQDDFEDTVHRFFSSGGYGLNVTLPFKHRAFAMADCSTDAYATMAQAANTMVFRDAQLYGYNTDGHGFIDDILDRCMLSVKEKDIFILGAGGAAAGVIPALIAAKVGSIKIWNRTESRAHTLAARFEGWVKPCDLDAIASCSLVVNALSRESDLTFLSKYLPPSCAYYDLSYQTDGTPTPFLDQAQQKGATQLFDGSGMLIRQAAHSFSIWFQNYPSVASVVLP